MLLLLLLHVFVATTKVGWSNFFLPLGMHQCVTANMKAGKPQGQLNLSRFLSGSCGENV